MGILKDIKIKIWPELVNYIPALTPLPTIQQFKSNNIIFDFSNVRKVTSSGLVIALVNILQILEVVQNKRRWRIINPSDTYTDQIISNLGLYKILEDYLPHKDLFWKESQSTSMLQTHLGGRTLSLPIYTLKFRDYKDRRDCLQPFVEWLLNILSEIEEGYDFDANNFIPILLEMGKNSADHTTGNAFFGIDYTYEPESKTVRIGFSFSDLGIGINQTIAKFIRTDTRYSNKDSHLSLSDAYHYAIGSGNTTKPTSTDNRGLGMFIIYNMAKSQNIHLSVFDANSRGILSEAKDKTHTELRKVFFNVGHSVGFYYYGELILSKTK